MAASYPSFGHKFVVKTTGIEEHLLAMSELSGLNRTAFINTKLAEHFNLKPIHESIEGDRALTAEDEDRMQILRAQYLLLGSKSGFNPETSATEDLIAIIQTCRAEVERRKSYIDCVDPVVV